MTAAAPAQTPLVPLQRRLALRAHPLACALAVVAVLTAVRLTGTVDSDVAWQLWTAQRLQAGAQLYRDIIEVNPPLWFWMAIPIERLSTLLQVRIESVAIVTISLLAALSLAATERMLAHLSMGRRAAFLAYAALVLVAVPWMHTGQREQIALIAALPYAALIATRARDETVPSWLAAAVGIGAGLGFGLKHYFLIVPVLLELWLILVRRRGWRPLRPETLALASTGIAYAAAILLLAPEYLRTIVPLVQLLYGAFGAPSWAAMFGPFAVVTAILLTALAAQGRLLASRDTTVATGLFVAALGFSAAYLIQFKGWPYHTLSALGCAALAIAALLAEATRGARLFRIVGPAFLVLPMVLAAKEQMNEPLPSADLIGAVAGVDRGATVGFLGTEAAAPWSVTLQQGFRYPSRYISHWMVLAVEKNRRRELPDPRVESAWTNVVRQTVQDFRCLPPVRIIVARPAPGDTASFDILPMFTRDPAFAALLGHYRPISRTSFEAYELVRPLPRLPSSQCRRGI